MKNSHIGPCKHLIALRIKYDSGFYETVEEIPEIKRKTYSQDWKLYNMAQMQEFELFDQFLYQLVSTVEEPEKPHRCGRPELKLPTNDEECRALLRDICGRTDEQIDAIFEFAKLAMELKNGRYR